MTVRMFCAGLVAAAAFATAAPAEVWRMQVSTASGDLIYRVLEGWAADVKAASGGRIEIQWSPINAIVSLADVMESVGDGILDGEFTGINVYTGKDKAFAVLGDLVAGYDTPWQVYQFCTHGGGMELLRELTAPYDVHVVGCVVTGKEAFVSAVPIRKVEDFAGVKVRAPAGLASELFSRAGAAPVGLPVSEIYGALERRVIDAADAGVFALNHGLGYHGIARYPLYPGIHSMPLHQITVTKARWDALPEDLRALFEMSVRELQLRLIMESDLADAAALAEARADPAVEIIAWPQAERDRFRAIARSAWEAYAADSPNARRVLDAHMAFMDRIGLAH